MPFKASISFEARQLSCYRQQHRIFSNVSFQLKNHDCLLIEGINGAGKSTLIKMLAGLITPSEGTVHWQQSSINTHRDQFISNMHYIGHQNGLILGLSVFENIKRMSILLNETVSQTKLTDTLSRLKLSEKLTTPIHQLSAGQRRRVAIAKLILFPRALWLLDEPLTSLDKDTQAMVTELLLQHIRTGGIIVLSSHQPLLIQEVEINVLRLNEC